MALTSTEEAQTRALIAQNAALLSLASNEAAIISELGAGDVTLADLPVASSLSDTDLFLVRQGTTEKSVAKSLIATTVPDASTTVKGIVEIATVAEAQAGTDTVRVVTPEGLASAINILGKSSDRQTVLFGNVDANGLPSFGGTTGTTTVNTSTTIIVSAANGINNRIGTIVNPSFTGITANSWATLTVTNTGTCTTNVRTLQPIEQFGGTPSITNGQLTFDIQDMKMYLGNGTTADEVYEVIIGRFTASGTVSSILWFAVMSRYYAPAGTNPNNSQTAISLNHNVNSNFLEVQHRWVCNTAELGYSIGDVVNQILSASCVPIFTGVSDSLAVGYIASIGAINLCHKSTSTVTAITLARWNYQPIVKRIY